MQLTAQIRGRQPRRRMARARQVGAERHLIAAAEVAGNYLLVWSCEPRLYVCSLSSFPFFKGYSEKALQKFEISPSGSRIHWPKGDVDLDLSAIRYHSLAKSGVSGRGL
ncbi:MAG: DUF2442 domain-containing protein [Bdellovibrionota bacterium]